MCQQYPLRNLRVLFFSAVSCLSEPGFGGIFEIIGITAEYSYRNETMNATKITKLIILKSRIVTSRSLLL